MEAMKILPLLTSSESGEKQSFHVVAPSLPNCGFSQRTSKPRFGVLQHAEVCHKLMLQLGYGKYGNRPLTPLSSHSNLSHSSYSSRRLGISDYPRDGHALPQPHFGVAPELCVDSATIATFYTALSPPIPHRKTHAS
jgi:hypothetical protein